METLSWKFARLSTYNLENVTSKYVGQRGIWLFCCAIDECNAADLLNYFCLVGGPYKLDEFAFCLAIISENFQFD